MNDPITPGEIVRRHLAALPMTHTEAALRIEVGPTHFNRITGSRIQITPKVAYRLQVATGLDALHLLTEQARWQLHHLAAGKWPYPPRKPPRPVDEEEEEL